MKLQSQSLLLLYRIEEGGGYEEAGAGWASHSLAGGGVG